MTVLDLTPVSAEQRLILRRMVENNDPIAYNILLRLKVHGRLDIGAFRSAMNAIVRRHHAFHVAFEQRHGEWFQRVSEPEPARINIVDLTMVPDADRVGRVSRLVRAFIHRPFDIAEGYLLRSLVLQMDAEEWELVFCYHHLVMDAWSQRLMLLELAERYSAEVDGWSLPLTPVGQCTDHAHWQEHTFTARQQEQDLAYWLAELGGCSQVLDLPTDHPRNGRRTNMGRIHELVAPLALLKRLRAVSANAGVTYFQGVLAATAIWLWSLTGRRSLILSIPFFNREPEHEQIITCTASPIYLRCDTDPDASFTEVAARVGARFFAAVEHRSVPTTRLLDALTSQGSWVDQHLPSAAVTLRDDLRSDDITMRDLHVEVTPEIIDDIAHVDVLFSLRPTPAGLSVEILHSAELFEPETMARWADDWLQTLTRLVMEPTIPLRDLVDTRGGAAEGRGGIRDRTDRGDRVSDTADLDKLIANYAAGPFQDSTPLAAAGVVSLSVFRIIADLAPDPGREIDAERLARVHTVADLKEWLIDLTTDPTP